jgi:hypothetical protein
MIARGTVWLNLKYAASNDQSGGRDVRSLKQAKSENTQRKSTVPSAYYDASLWVPKVTKLTLGKHTEAFVQKCK